MQIPNLKSTENIKALWEKATNLYSDIPYSFGRSSLTFLANYIGMSPEAVLAQNKERGITYLKTLVQRLTRRDFCDQIDEGKYEDFEFIQRYREVSTTSENRGLAKGLLFNFDIAGLKSSDIKIIRERPDLQLLNARSGLNKRHIIALGLSRFRVFGDVIRCDFIDPQSCISGGVQISGSDRRRLKHYQNSFFFVDKDRYEQNPESWGLKFHNYCFDFSFELNAPLLRSCEEFIVLNGGKITTFQDAVETQNCSRLAEIKLFKFIWEELKNIGQSDF